MLTAKELELLQDALGNFMSDAYGDGNEEGCWSQAQWDELQTLSDKLATMRRESASQQNWPCDRTIIHPPHESADGKQKCAGMTNAAYIRMAMPEPEES